MSGTPGAASDPAPWRRGRFATVAGRTFPVRLEGRAWREVDHDGALTGPTYEQDDLDRLFTCYHVADLDGVEVGVDRIEDGVARISTLGATPELVARHHLDGNQRDGWFGAVPATSLQDLREQVAERDTGYVLEVRTERSRGFRPRSTG